MIVSSAAGAETGVAYYVGKDAVPLRIALEEMGRPKPAALIKLENVTAVGILNDSIRQRRSKAWDMRFYWIKDRHNIVSSMVSWFHQPQPASTIHKHAIPIYSHTATAEEQQQKKPRRVETKKSKACDRAG